MIGYMLQRLWQSLFVLLAVTVIAFAMLISAIRWSRFRIGLTAEQRERGASSWARSAARRAVAFPHPRGGHDFGVSPRLGHPVDAVLIGAFPTVELAVAGMALALLIGIPAGIYTAVYRQGHASQLLLGASLLGISLPSFFMGLLLIWLFSVTLGWLPSFGRGDTVSIGGWSVSFLTASGLRSLILPALTLAGFQVAMIMRLVRAEMLEVLPPLSASTRYGIRNRALYSRTPCATPWCR
jgi:peptide/nickel transport system permease protein